jgi:tRNA-2-methylthio-N6-dimethylallyladenosine synthase
VAEAVKADRLAGLQQLLGEQTIAFNTACIGRDLPVLLERPGRRPGQLLGRSPYMQSVHVAVPEVAMDRLTGTLMDVHIEGAYPNSLSGRLTVDGQVVGGRAAEGQPAGVAPPTAPSAPSARIPA